jgi:hypothetical protein
MTSPLPPFAEALTELISLYSPSATEPPQEVVNALGSMLGRALAARARPARGVADQVEGFLDANFRTLREWIWECLLANADDADA